MLKVYIIFYRVHNMKLTLEKQICHRCHHSWWPRIKDDQIAITKTCPRCRSPYWDRPIQRKTVSNALKKK